MYKKDKELKTIWKQIRAETPACYDVIHFNNAGAALMPRVVTNAVIDYITLEAKIGGYEATQEKWPEIQKIYESIGKLIGASPDEIALMENATKAWQVICYGIGLSKGDIILTTHSEYGSNYLAFLHLKEKFGVEIEMVADDEWGQISIQDLIQTIHRLKKEDRKIKLLSLTHVPSQGGLINPAEKVGKIARENGIFYLLDATQSIGHISINIKKIGCDALCATGRKYLRAPRGTGFLYLNSKRLKEVEPLVLDFQSAIWTGLNSFEIGNDAKRFETWEKSYANILGLKAAVDYCLELGIDNIERRILELSAYFRRKLREISKIELTDLGENQCGIITFRLGNSKNEHLINYLKKNNLNFTVIPIRRTWNDFERRNIENVIRTSIHYYNTEEEIDKLCELLIDYKIN